MSDSYQATRVPYPVCVHGDVTTWRVPESVLELMVERGSLILDTRVDAIVAAWVKTREMGVRFYMNDGLAALLDALAEDNDG